MSESMNESRSELRNDLAERIRQAALESGFDRCAIAPVERLRASERLREWLDDGMHGTMGWMERSYERRADPRRVVPDARSVLLVTRNYFTGHPATEDPRRGRISRYAWGDEYHEALGAGLRDLYERLRALVPGIEGRWYVDTGPVLEKAWAELAGLGWIGKHTNLISVATGSWFFLGAIVVDAELPAGPAPARDHCGTCSACIDVCPTRAIVAPYVLDARLCISYLTIENRGPIPTELRAPMGNRIFGCDECQDVCPWNRFARASHAAAAFAPRDGLQAPELVDLMRLDDDGFRRTFRGSPIKRAKRSGFLRNVAVALGNSGAQEAIPALVRALDDSEPLVRGHAAWALGRLGGGASRRGLEARADRESDSWVAGEIAAALEALTPVGRQP